MLLFIDSFKGLDNIIIDLLSFNIPHFVICNSIFAIYISNPHLKYPPMSLLFSLLGHSMVTGVTLVQWGNKVSWRNHKILEVDLCQFCPNRSAKGMTFLLPIPLLVNKRYSRQFAELIIILKRSVRSKNIFRLNITF